MKKGIIVWIIVALVVLIAFFLFTKPPTPSCDDLVFSVAERIIGAYKDFSYFIIFLVAGFLGWISYHIAERKAATKEKGPYYDHILWLGLIGYVVTALVAMGFYFLAPKFGWFSMDLMECSQWKDIWWADLVKVKSLFGRTFIQNFEIAHLSDMLLLYVIIFAAFFFITRYISNLGILRR